MILSSTQLPEQPEAKPGYAAGTEGAYAELDSLSPFKDKVSGKLQ